MVPSFVNPYWFTILTPEEKLLQTATKQGWTQDEIDTALLELWEAQDAM